MAQFSDQGVQFLLRDEVEVPKPLEVVADVSYYGLFDGSFDSPSFALQCTTDPSNCLAQLAFRKGQLEAQNSPYEDDGGSNELAAFGRSGYSSQRVVDVAHESDFVRREEALSKPGD